MTELSPETRAFLEATAGGDGPSADDRARIRHKLAVKLGAAALATTTLAVAAEATAASSLSTAATSVAVGKASAGAGVSFLGKIAIAAAVAGAVSSTAVIALQSIPSSADSAVSAPKAAHGPRHASARPAALPEPGVTAVEVVAAPIAPAVEPAAEELAAPQPARARSREAKRAAPTAESNMTEELALLRQAQTALREGRAVDALRVTTDHAARFPQGALREERAAVDMLARCAQGSASAELLATFLDAAPESPLKARVRQACKIEP